MKPSTEKDEGRHPRPFGEWLLEQRAGGLHIELGDRLAELVEAVVDVGKKGSLVLTIEVKPAGRGGVTVIVADKIVAKIPEGDKPESTYFVDGCRLVRNNPNQGELGELREVPKPDGGAEMKQVAR